MYNEFEKGDPTRLADLMQAEPLVPASPLHEGVGSRIGGYRLLSLIGEGGFGSVFVAQQEAPVVRKVAVKIIKLGMDTRQVVARFAAERQALALMDHPNIARVLDAGITPSGRPFFVMEWVDGLPITRYCDELHLAPRQRLELFLAVCNAVQHAHQKGILHRDLKPSNILVAESDGVAVPKVIDFGIAKAIDARGAEQTLLTEFGQFVGTPNYASPEQLTPGGRDIDTRSDVYSLGAVLYELLTGRLPYDGQHMPTNDPAEWRRLVRLNEPAVPSSRVTAGNGSSETRARFNLDGRALGQFLRGEVDWIVMRCLEKEPERRYPGVGDLAADLRRFLADEPVEAGPPSRLYRLRKALRRHRAAFGTAAALGVVLAGSFIATAVGMLHARRAQSEATEQRDLARGAQAAEKAHRREAEQLAHFLQEMLTATDPYNGGDRPATTVAQLLDAAAQKLDADTLCESPRIAADLRTTLADTYNNLSEPRKAREQYRKAVELVRAAYGDSSKEMAAILLNYSQVAINHTEELALLHRSLALRRALLGPDAPDTAMAEARVAARDEHIEAHEAERRLLRSVEVLRKAPPGEYASGLRDALVDLAALMIRRRDWIAAERYLAEAAAVDTRRPNTRVQLAGDWSDLAYVLGREGRPDDAEAYARKAWELTQQVLGDNANETRERLSGLISLMDEHGKTSEAEPLARSLWGSIQKSPESVADLGANTARIIAAACRQRGDADGFRQWTATRGRLDLASLKEQVSELTARIGQAPADLLLLRQRANLYARAGMFAEAAADYRQVLQEDPFGGWKWLDALPVLLAAGDADGYVAWRSKLLAHSAQATDPSTCERAAKICLFLPVDRPESVPVLRLARTALTEPAFDPWRFASVGMASYRAGDDRAAVAWFQEARSYQEDTLDAICSLFLSMAYHRMGSDAEAWSALSRGLWLSRSILPRPGVADLGDAYRDLIFLRRLESEAAACFADRGALVASAEGAAVSLQAPQPPLEWRAQELRRIEAHTAHLTCSPDDAISRAARGEHLARLGRFVEAAGDFDRAIDCDPTNYAIWNRGLCVFVSMGDAAAYRRRRHEALERFEHSRDPYHLDRIAKAAMILPLEGADLQRALAMALAARDGLSARRDEAAGAFCLGLARFRASDFGAAIEELARADSRGAADSTARIRAATAQFVLALSYAQTRQPADGERAFRLGTQLLAPLENPNLYIANYQDLILCEALRKEAMLLIQAPQSRSSRPPH